MGKSTKVKIAESSIEKLGRILSSNFGIKVVFKKEGSERWEKVCPMTDGKTIILPMLPDDASDELIAALHGYVDHEASHLLFSQFEPLAEMQEKGQTFLKYFANVLEDPRVESKMKALWPGTAKNFRNYLEYASKENVKAYEEAEKAGKPINALSKLLGAFCHYGLTGKDEDNWYWKDHVPHEIQQCVRDHVDIIDRAYNAKDTQETVDLASELMKRLNIEEPKSNAKNPEEAAKMLKKWEEEGADPGKYPLKSKVKIDIENSDGSKIEDEIESEDVVQQQQESEEGTGDKIKAQANYELKESDQEYYIYTTETDEIEKMASQSNDRSTFHQLETGMSNTMKVAQRKLSRALVTQTYARWDNDKDRGLVNRRALSQLIIGANNRVFKQKGIDIHFDTVVTLAIDHSGSMGGDKADTAAQTAIMLGNVLNTIGVPFSCVGFSTGNGSDAYERVQKASAEDQQLFTRWGSLWIGQYKGFGDSWQHKKHRVSQIPNNIRANTYDGESVRWCARELLARKEKRKILIFVNDGEPCPNGADNHGAHVTFAKKVGKEIGKHIEMVAIGIHSHSIKEFYPKAININNVAELGGVALKELAKFLTPTFKNR